MEGEALRLGEDAGTREGEEQIGGLVRGGRCIGEPEDGGSQSAVGR